jgi:CYTH domain-containing protein
LEIERKFLVDALPFDLSEYNKSEIIQSYISFSPTIRLRGANGSFFLTCKGEGTLSREEFEIQITETQYNHLMTKIDGQTIYKTRYYIPLQDNYTAELDIYHNERLNGLITVEVEFKTLDDAKNFAPPQWFSKDVTENSGYSNSSLAQIL